MQNNVEINYITWSIDRTPDYTVYNNDNHDSNIINIIDNQNQESETNDFIPFEPLIRENRVNFVLEIITISSDDDLQCCVCMELRENPQICQLNCSHKFCSECIFRHISRNRNNSSCPLCRKFITNIIIQTEEDLEFFQNI